MKSMVILADGAAKRSLIIEPSQWLSPLGAAFQPLCNSNGISDEGRTFAEVIQAVRQLRTALRLAGHGDAAQSAEIVQHTLRTMQSPSFHQSQALQELARRNFADLDAKLKALS